MTTPDEKKTDAAVRCPLCGVQYDAQEAESGCRGCPMKQGCEMVRCPNCGFETILD